MYGKVVGQTNGDGTRRIVGEVALPLTHNIHASCLAAVRTNRISNHRTGINHNDGQ